MFRKRKKEHPEISSRNIREHVSEMNDARWRLRQKKYEFRGYTAISRNRRKHLSYIEKKTKEKKHGKSVTEVIRHNL